MAAICAVIVLYGERADESLTVETLRRALRESPQLAAELLVCVYDNTPRPEPIAEPLFTAETLIFQPGVNGGLPPAYNQALEVAEARGINWLLLLDSDTEIRVSFLQACIAKTVEVEGACGIAAIVPHVTQGALVHSPRKVQFLRRRAVETDYSGLFGGELIALNSGTVLRVSAVRSIGGFSPEFWLDYLDYWLFRVLQADGFQVYVMKESIAHRLSLADPGRRMSLERYQNMLEAEQYFTSTYGSAWERVRIKFVLLSRAFRYAIRPLTRQFVPLTVAAIMQGARDKPPQPPPVPSLEG